MMDDEELLEETEEESSTTYDLDDIHEQLDTIIDLLQR